MCIHYPLFCRFLLYWPQTDLLALSIISFATAEKVRGTAYILPAASTEFPSPEQKLIGLERIIAFRTCHLEIFTFSQTG